jgi:hypothetical protein
VFSRSAGAPENTKISTFQWACAALEPSSAKEAAKSAKGQNSEIRAHSPEVRFPLESRHGAPGLSGLKSARNRSEATRAYGSASCGDNLFDPCQPRILFRADPGVASKRWRPLDLENTALSPPIFD